MSINGQHNVVSYVCVIVYMEKGERSEIYELEENKTFFFFRYFWVTHYDRFPLTKGKCAFFA